MPEHEPSSAESVERRPGLGIIVLVNVLAVPVALVMAMAIWDYAASIQAGGRLLDPKDAHNSAIGLMTVVVFPFVLYLIYFMNLGETTKQAQRALLSLLIVVVPYSAYSLYTTYVLFAPNSPWLAIDDAPRSLTSALGLLSFCGCLSFGTIVRRRIIIGFGKKRHPLCQRCGYDLTGLTVARCPECGIPFDSKLLENKGQ